MFKRIAIGSAVAATLLVSGVSFAGPGWNLTPEQRAEKIERRVKQKLAPELGLDERTASRLADVLKAAAERQVAARKKVHAERDALQGLVDRKAPAGEIDAQLKRLADARAAVPRRDAVFDETRRILSPEQQAKLELLMPKRFGGRHGGRGRHGGPGGHCGEDAPE